MEQYLWLALGALIMIVERILTALRKKKGVFSWGIFLKNNWIEISGNVVINIIAGIAILNAPDNLITGWIIEWAGLPLYAIGLGLTAGMFVRLVVSIFKFARDVAWKKIKELIGS